MSRFIQVQIKRQDGPQNRPYLESFQVPWRPNLNIISLLMEIRNHPITDTGRQTTPVVWECNCLEEVCGACTMLINGRARQACSALVDTLKQPVKLAPLSKFPVVRDLMVDRQVMFDNLKKVKAWIPVDGTYDLGPGPRLAEKTRRWAYEISKCMTCGCCAEACPNFNSRSNFIGPAPLAQVRLFNAHPTGEMNREERLDAIMGEGGITDCGNAQNCVRACPKEIPLTTAIAELNRDTTRYAIERWRRR